MRPGSKSHGMCLPYIYPEPTKQPNQPTKANTSINTLKFRQFCCCCGAAKSYTVWLGLAWPGLLVLIWNQFLLEALDKKYSSQLCKTFMSVEQMVSVYTASIAVLFELYYWLTQCSNYPKLFKGNCLTETFIIDSRTTITFIQCF